MDKNNPRLCCQIGHIIRAERRKYGYTQPQLAHRLDVSVATIQSIENGKQLPHCLTLFFIAELFSPDFIVQIQSTFQDHFLSNGKIQCNQS